MDQYVVLCDCDPDKPSDVGYIDDDRPNGGRLELEAWPPQPGGTRVTPTSRGHRRSSQLLECPRCEQRVQLSDTTAAEIVDLMVRTPPGAVASLRDVWGRTLVPFEDYVDDAARIAEVEDEMFSERDPYRPSDVPTVTRYARLYKIPLTDLRRMVSEFDKRR